MKKSGIINQPISTIIAGLGHTDRLVIADAGLPIHPQLTRIDLALKAGMPSFMETLRVVLSEMQVESAIIAKEMIDRNPRVYQDVLDILGEIPITIIPHEEFKRQTSSARGVIRTGEFTPYANIILVSGVVF